VNQNILYEKKTVSCMTTEEVKDPDCECLFSSAVRLWWLTERETRTEIDREGRCFKVCTTKILAPAVVNSFLSQIVVTTRYYFFTVIYRGIFSQSL
jgi:hypothetical protein